MPTPESSLESLAIRVAKLEAQNRRLKKAVIAALFIAMAVLTMGRRNRTEPSMWIASRRPKSARESSSSV